MDWVVPSIGTSTSSSSHTMTSLTWIGRVLRQTTRGNSAPDIPMRRKQHAAALGRALVVHWTFSIQEKGLLANTTLLERYRALAEEVMAENAKRHYNGEWQPRGHLWER
mmetsp:Transcript_13832/g.31063  ORF Transcript_13832/g.31063 Transcript_13832/m.31063 type:complete len:109 (+) Transcript_13832:644-970(+)